MRGTWVRPLTDGNFLDSLTQRLVRLPSHSVDPGDPDGSLVRKWTKRFAKSGEFDLRPVQAAALEVLSQIAAYDGVGGYLQMAVGSGKTLVNLLASQLYDNVKRPLLLLPPDLVPELEAEIFRWQRHFDIKVPDYLTFSKLSQPTSSAYLEEIGPDLIIIDESQNLSNPNAARTKRFLRYLKEHPKTRVICLTGTITDQSIVEYSHLLKISIGPLTFIPDARAAGRPNPEFSKWRAVLDKGGKPSWNDVRAFEGLAKHYKVGWDSSDITGARDCARKAYFHRLKSSMGVLLTKVSSCTLPLHIEVLSPDFGEDLRGTVREVQETWMLPNGDDIVDGTEMARHLSTLSLGFYNRWDWDAVDADSDWNKARLAWASEVRAYLKGHSREGCDSPALVERWVREESPKNNLSVALRNWDAVRDLTPPPTVPIWVTYKVLLWAKDWVKQQDEPAILWYHSRAVGEKLGVVGVQVKTSKPKPNPASLPKVALPISVFHKGHNLQGYRRHLVIEPRSSGKIMEQLLGRAHRGGQTKDVHFKLLGWTWKQQGQVVEAVSRAHYAQTTTGQEQKLLLAQWTNAPDGVTKTLERT